MSLFARCVPSFFVACVAFLLDLISKDVIFSRLGGGDSYSIAWFLQLRPFLNTGTVFGWHIDESVILAVSWVGVITIFFAGVAYIQKRSEFLSLLNMCAVGLLCGGAVSNLYDRIIFGAVRDWIEVPGFTIFNIADTWVVLGAILLLLTAMSGTIEKD